MKFRHIQIRHCSHINAGICCACSSLAGCSPYKEVSRICRSSPLLSLPTSPCPATVRHLVLQSAKLWSTEPPRMLAVFLAGAHRATSAKKRVSERRNQMRPSQMSILEGSSCLEAWSRSRPCASGLLSSLALGSPYRPRKQPRTDAQLCVRATSFLPSASSASASSACHLHPNSPRPLRCSSFWPSSSSPCCYCPHPMTVSPVSSSSWRHSLCCHPTLASFCPSFWSPLCCLRPSSSLSPVAKRIKPRHFLTIVETHSGGANPLVQACLNHSLNSFLLPFSDIGAHERQNYQAPFGGFAVPIPTKNQKPSQGFSPVSFSGECTAAPPLNSLPSASPSFERASVQRNMQMSVSPHGTKRMRWKRMDSF